MQSELIQTISSAAVQQFIMENEKSDEREIVLKKQTILNVPAGRIAEQIVGRRKAQTKLPTIYKTPGIVYPSSVSIEQSSSELTAQFKADLLKELLPEAESLVDLTGGFGVDSYHFSRNFKSVCYVEPDESLFTIARHNHARLNATNVIHQNTTAERYLLNESGRVGAGFIDPSRRSQGEKVFRFSECSPDVIALLPSIFNVTDHVLIKASPLLDLTKSITELAGVSEICILSVSNECKEVLFFCQRRNTTEPKIVCINLEGETEQRFEFSLSAERTMGNALAKPMAYLYEPNSSILKAGAFKSIGDRYQLAKLDVNTHLYTSADLLMDFPGRIFEVKQLLKNAQELNQVLPGRKANLISRNFPSSVDQLKASLRITDGGSDYILATTSLRRKLFIWAHRLK